MEDFRSQAIRTCESQPRQSLGTIKGERSVVPGRVHEAPWRELHSLMVRRATATDVGGPLAFENLDSNCAFDIWTGALAGDQAKVVDTIEQVCSRDPIPQGLKVRGGRHRRLLHAVVDARVAAITATVRMHGLRPEQNGFRLLNAFGASKRNRARLIHQLAFSGSPRLTRRLAAGHVPFLGCHVEVDACV